MLSFISNNPFCSLKRSRIEWENFEEEPPTKKFLSESLASRIYDMNISNDEHQNNKEKSFKKIDNPVIPKKNIMNPPPIIPKTILPAE